MLPNTEVHPHSSVTHRHIVGAAGPATWREECGETEGWAEGRGRLILGVQDQEAKGTNRGRTKVQS